VLAVLPIRYINAVDALFGLVLLMILAASAGWRKLGWFPAAVLGPLAVVMINPEIVNVSSLYTGAALVATCVLLVASDRERSIPALPLGITYAALVALKPTFGVFIIIHLPLAALAVRERTGNWRMAVRWMGQVALWSIVALAPWVLVHLPNYVRSTASDRQLRVIDISALESIPLFSTAPLFWGAGATFIDYTASVAVVALGTIAAGISICFVEDRHHRASAYGIIAGTASVVMAYPVFVLAVGSALSVYESNLRYTIPILLGAGVVSLVLALGLPSPIRRRLNGAVLTLGISGVFAVFAPSFLNRCRQAITQHNVLGFSKTPQMGAFLTYYTKSVTGDDFHAAIAGLQSRVPPGEPIVVWVYTPFHLDYRRNPIIDVEPDGLTSPWAHPPAGVKYYIWEYAGPVVRDANTYRMDESAYGTREQSIAVHGLAFVMHLSQMAKQGTILYSDGRYVVL
jgi:hypothetical protein